MANIDEDGCQNTTLWSYPPKDQPAKLSLILRGKHESYNIRTT